MHKNKFEHLLTQVLKPTRYIGSEINAFYKNFDESEVKFCLAFPDVYEVGISHLGLKILYTILNNEADTIADRVYAPWPDFGQKLLEEEIDLFGIETQKKLNDFDVIGFTLQSEVTFTNILYMLELAKIPFEAKNRDDSYPIILAGGPCAANPMPLKMFFDAFFIGEAEETIIEIKNVIKNSNNKTETLQKLSQIKGVYVPSIEQSSVEIAKYNDFSSMAKAHKNQLIPWLQPTHDRYVSEIMRGCGRGCRFCHAGFFYRPIRERKPELILDELISEVKNGGWEDAALVSLSSSDYSCIKELISNLYFKLKENKAELSLPSLRVDTLDDDLTKLMNATGAKGLTIAPEAGSQRLRNIINKNLSEEEILKGVNVALENGWQLIKLYFMIGLPFENEQDILAITELVEKIIGISKKRLRINITLSPFIPKPFTPFQWNGMKDDEYLTTVAKQVKSSLYKYKFVKVHYHEIDSSVIEACLSRGDENVGKLIYAAYKNGAKFDGWREFFNINYWQKAEEETKIEIKSYLNAYSFDDELPWQKINIGLKPEFLKNEYLKAKNAEVTPDCKTECTSCGVCSKIVQPSYVNSTFNKIDEKIEKRQVSYVPINPYYYRVYYSKTGMLKYVGHLDVLRMVNRLIRSANIPIAYTQGYNPHPKIALSPPVGLGVEGLDEYFDLGLTEKVNFDDLLKKIKLPKGMKLKRVEVLTDKKMRAQEYFEFEEVEIDFDEDQRSFFKSKTTEFSNAETWVYDKVRKKKTKQVDLKLQITKIEVKDNTICLIKKLRGASIFDILNGLYGIDRNQTDNLSIKRIRLIPENV